MTTTQQQQDSEQSQTSEGEATEPPHEANIDLSSSISSQTTIMPNGINALSVPLPPPEAGTYEKQPGHTVGSLKKLVLSTSSPTSATMHTKQPSMTSSSPSTPNSSSGEDQHSDWISEPPTRPPTQPSSRSPSMSAGISGGKLMIPMSAISQSSPGTPVSQKPPAPKIVQKSTSTPSTPHPPAQLPASANGKHSKAASVHSNDGKEDKHKFNLKDLLAATPKLSRKSSQRSTGSSRKSDTDRDSIHDGYGRGSGPYGSGPRSTAGDSTTSLSKKYGVCQKLAIGKGATSVVRLAHKWDRTEEKLYAVKEFRKRRKNESEKEYVKKLTSEFCISSTLHHVNIVETVDLVQDENLKWCEVMEFCPGGDLYAAIKKGGMSPSEVECCFKQILSGVKYLHAQGVAHRDIKPENLFFDTKGHLKIGDYGASTVYRLPWESTIHMSTGLCGSEPYIAPEQFLGKPYDARLVDIWACGIVYYCLHFSELPWRAAQPTDTLYQAYAVACSSSSTSVSTCPPTINNLSPRACRSLIRKMLEPDPKSRSSIEEVWKHAWIDTIEVCHEVDSPRHVHVHARALAQQQMGGST